MYVCSFFVTWGGVRLSPLGTSPTSGLLYQPRMMNVEQSVEWELERETEILGEHLPQRHFLHHKSHMTCSTTRAAAVGSRQLTAWGMARLCMYRI
jgi:hypothetical protein